MPTLWPKLHLEPEANNPTDNSGRMNTINVSNGDTLTLELEEVSDLLSLKIKTETQLTS